jgi:hypothetical protein
MYDIFFRYKFNFFYLTKNRLIVGDKILTYQMKDKCNYYNTKDFNYGLRLSRYIGLRHFLPEEQKPIYRSLALKGLKMNLIVQSLICIVVVS